MYVESATQRWVGANVTPIKWDGQQMRHLPGRHRLPAASPSSRKVLSSGRERTALSFGLSVALCEDPAKGPLCGTNPPLPGEPRYPRHPRASLRSILGAEVWKGGMESRGRIGRRSPARLRRLLPTLTRYPILLQFDRLLPSCLVNLLSLRAGASKTKAPQMRLLATMGCGSMW